MLTKHVLQTCRALSAYQFGTWFAPIGVVVVLDARALQEVFFGSTQGSARGPKEKYLNSSLNKWPSNNSMLLFAFSLFDCLCYHNVHVFCDVLPLGLQTGHYKIKNGQWRPLQNPNLGSFGVGFLYGSRFWTHVWDLVKAPPFLSHVWNWLIHIQNTISKQLVIICYTETTSWN